MPFDFDIKIHESEQMSDELFTSDGKRKYLTAEERERFVAAAAQHHRGEVRTLCMVMAQADIVGHHATSKGLPHGFDVNTAATRNLRLVQKWLGDQNLDTTAIYMDAVGDEEREMAVGQG